MVRCDHASTQCTTKAALAADAWRSVFDFIVATVDHRIEVLARLGITPNDSRALGSLAQETGRTMRSLADEWRCDASTATWIVDRLEAKGLAERWPHPTDRRVKLVVLTAQGVQTKAEMIAGTYTPPPARSNLIERRSSRCATPLPHCAPSRSATR